MGPGPGPEQRFYTCLIENGMGRVPAQTRPIDWPKCVGVIEKARALLAKELWLNNPYCLLPQKDGGLTIIPNIIWS